MSAAAGSSIWCSVRADATLGVRRRPMSAVTTPQPPPAPRPSPPRLLRITVTQFNRMGDMGWFEGRRPFLLDGVIWEQGPMDPPHAIALGLVQYALQAVFGAAWWIRGQSPLHVDAVNDPLPDLAVVPGA